MPHHIVAPVQLFRNGRRGMARDCGRNQNKTNSRRDEGNSARKNQNPRDCVLVGLAVIARSLHLIQSLLQHRIALRLEFRARFPFGKFVGIGDLVADFE